VRLEVEGVVLLLESLEEDIRIEVRDLGDGSAGKRQALTAYPVNCRGIVSIEPIVNEAE
jgi:hypothetical protein